MSIIKFMFKNPFEAKVEDLWGFHQMTSFGLKETSHVPTFAPPEAFMDTEETLATPCEITVTC